MLDLFKNDRLEYRIAQSEKYAKEQGRSKDLAEAVAKSNTQEIEKARKAVRPLIARFLAERLSK